ncbi:faciogenital dysplasia protein [Anaeramoeba ignava]|uniref:Faciogenital dysplasia protein n=1 Tax=Anaeramoeba ignava TaxID=1746090 RepID=A0A9Q0L5E1_ANAIG|nr:faciogenital dysplasia protein [Anaeramoeba ignava]
MQKYLEQKNFQPVGKAISEPIKIEKEDSEEKKLLHSGKRRPTNQLQEILSEVKNLIEKPKEKIQDPKEIQRNNAAIQIQKICRGFLDRKRLLTCQEFRPAIKKRALLNELIETEKNYLHHIALMHTYYRKPLKEKKLVKNELLDQIFSNSEQLYQVNTLFYEKLLARKSDPNIFYYGDILSDFIPIFIKPYSHYVNNYDNAYKILDACMKNSSIAKLLAKIAADPLIKRLDLQTLLITPVQRIPRYSLLFEGFLKYTEPQHPDFQFLTQALEKINEVAQQVNRNKAESEMFEKLLSIEKQFKEEKIVLAEYGRKLIFEKKVNIFYQQRKSTLILFLFNDIALFAKRRKEGRLTKRHLIYIRNLIITVKKNDPMWIILFPAEIFIFCHDETEKTFLVDTFVTIQ